MTASRYKSTSIYIITCELHIVIWHRFVYFSCFPGCTFYAFQKQSLPQRQQVINCKKAFGKQKLSKNVKYNSMWKDLPGIIRRSIKYSI